MRATVRGRLAAVISRSYLKDGKRVEWRELHVVTSMSEAPESIRVDDQDPNSVGAFNDLRQCAWLDEVVVEIESQKFGQATAWTLRGAQLAKAKAS